MGYGEMVLYFWLLLGCCVCILFLKEISWVIIVGWCYRICEWWFIIYEWCEVYVEIKFCKVDLVWFFFIVMIIKYY